jgi:hypothetical protein
VTEREHTNFRTVGDLAEIQIGPILNALALLLQLMLLYLVAGSLVGLAGSTYPANYVASHCRILLKFLVFEAYFTCIYHVSLIFCGK